MERERGWGCTHVAEVGVGRIDLGAILLVEGHAPEAVVFAETGSVELVPERVRVLQRQRISSVIACTRVAIMGGRNAR